MIGDATGWELEPTPWARDAACAGTDPDRWFPGKGANLKPAKAVCAGCPVRQECLEYALAWNIADGIWGGLSARERRGLGPRRRARRLHGTPASYGRGCRCDNCRRANLRSETARAR